MYISIHIGFGSTLIHGFPTGVRLPQAQSGVPCPILKFASYYFYDGQNRAIIILLPIVNHLPNAYALCTSRPTVVDAKHFSYIADSHATTVMSNAF